MATMDVVQVFGEELNSLLDVKPPVSKAKMGQITRAAMKGVKFYKHIVQTVERFIARCRPEYKIPGLYVIDSIVRQSRHQFGPERDVYASRFSRNLQITFNNLFTGCAIDDKPKIVRVLNLWQKNGVFNSQVIQPLLDMANPNSTLTLPTESTLSADSPNVDLGSKQGQTSKYSAHHFNSNSAQFAKNTSSSADTKHHRAADGGLRFSKNMLDFDYDEDDDDDGDETPTEAEPPLSSTLNKIEMEQRGRGDAKSSSGHKTSQLHQYNQSHHQQVTTVAPGSAPSTGQSNTNPMRNDQDPVLERWNRLLKQQSITSESNSNDHSSSENRHKRPRSRSPQNREKQHIVAAKQPVVQPVKYKPEESSGGSSERDAERKAERQRKCLPPIRDKHLTVCSSTLWLGHVPKTVSEADISDAFGEYGTITSIDLIPPRGCAYVCMDRRQDAKKALTESKDLKLNGSHIKMAWAPGKGFKEYKKLKDFWEVDIGSSYIPYNKIDESIDFEVLEEGGLIDEDSMSMEMREQREKRAKEKDDKTRPQQASMSLPMPTLPILTQPPPFAVPPNLNIPPPTALSQGAMTGIPFPPPNVTSANNSLVAQFDKHQTDSQDSRDNNETMKSPISIDQQISMTERQINMVEQQLSMIQQAQGLTQTPTSMAPSMHPQTMFHPQNQPNPLIFDLPPPQMLGGQLMDPHHGQQIPIFANPNQLLTQPPQMLPISQANMNLNINGNQMPPYRGHF